LGGGAQRARENEINTAKRQNRFRPVNLLYSESLTKSTKKENEEKTRKNKKVKSPE
jgi:hypothetical protein